MAEQEDVAEQEDEDEGAVMKVMMTKRVVQVVRTPGTYSLKVFVVLLFALL
jgi:hypothetical protein